jgi:hypothetical protein
MMKIISDSEEAMVARSRQIDPSKRQMSWADARSMRIRCAETMMPYFHGKQPVRVDATIRGVLVREEIGDLRHVRGRTLDDEIKRVISARRIWGRGMSELEIRTLNSPGSISDAFLLSRAFIKIIIGPVGSAKTMTALRALRRVAMRQGGRVDGNGVLIRKARVGVIRETYPNIEKNTLPSWFRIHPESDGKFTWKAPFTHRLMLILDEDPETGRPTTCATSKSSSARSAIAASRKPVAGGKWSR